MTAAAREKGARGKDTLSTAAQRTASQQAALWRVPLRWVALRLAQRRRVAWSDGAREEARKGCHRGGGGYRRGRQGGVARMLVARVYLA